MGSVIESEPLEPLLGKKLNFHGLSVDSLNAIGSIVVAPFAVVATFKT